MSIVAPPVEILSPIYIGNVKVDPAITLAPMSQVTTHAFRALCKEAGGVGLVCTELLSSKAIEYRNQRTNGMMDWKANERPVAVQLFGNDPQTMATAAKAVADLGAEIVDINMGCWVPKVAGKGAGAALLKDVCLATAVVEAVVKAVDIPVTVKVRAGFEMNKPTALEFAKSAENAGVKLIAVHGRYAAQGFTGQADWSIIRRVKELVTIPVLGNGDILTPEDAERMLRETGCDGVMIGRAAMGNPWIFRRIEHYLKTGEHLPEPTNIERLQMTIRHAQLAVETSAFDEFSICLRLRTQLPPYLTGIPGKRWACEHLKKLTTLKDIEAMLTQLLEWNGHEPGI